MPSGPVQLLVVGFGRAADRGQALAEFERLRDGSAVRLIDLLVVHKDADGVIAAAGASEDAGALVERLLGFGPEGHANGATLSDDEFWSVDNAIPNDSDAVIALIEHRWAIGTRDAIHAAGGSALADAWIHPADLVAAGLSDR